MGDLLAPWHLLVLLLIVVVIFGPSKIGDLGGAMGKAIRDFKRAMNEPEPGSKPPVNSAETPTAEAKPVQKIS